MCTKKELSQITDEAIQGLRRIYGEKLVNIILFGSYARGDYDEQSDIDIAVILDLDRLGEKRYKTELIEFSSALDLKYDVLTSFRCIPEAEYDKWKNSLPFYMNIEKEGVKLGA